MKKKWITYAAIGLVGLGIGYTLHSLRPLEGSHEPVHPTVQKTARLPQQQSTKLTAQESLETQPKKNHSSIACPPSPDSAYSGIINQFSLLNPEIYQEIQTRHELALLREIIIKTARDNPAYAASLLEGIPDESTQQSLIGALVDEWVITDPRSAYEWYNGFHRGAPDETHAHYMEAILFPMARMDPEYTWSIIDTIQDPTQKDIAMKEIAIGWMDKDPAGAFDWLESSAMNGTISPSTLKNCYRSAMTKYMEIDPAGAAQAIQKLESERLQSQLAGPAALNLAEQDLGAAMDWLLQLDHKSVRDEGINSIVNSYAVEEPEAVLDLVIANQDMTEEGITTMGEAFSLASEQNPDLAVLRLQEVPEKALPQVVEILTQNWLCIDEQRATEWLNNQPPGPTLDAGAASVVHHYLSEEPGIAFEWACVVSNPEKRSQLFNEMIDYTNPAHLKDIYMALQEAPVSADERPALLSKLNKRLKDEYASLVLP